MTRIKMCGLRRPEDIEAANELKPEYIGFVFFPGSRRYTAPETAKALKAGLDPEIRAVGVFVDEDPVKIAALLEDGVIDLAQLHGHEDAAYVDRLRKLTDKPQTQFLRQADPQIQAFRVRSEEDALRAQASAAEEILLDAGAGDGKTFDWSWLRTVSRPYFLAGGLNPENAAQAVRELHPFAVDVSSGIETDGYKDRAKMSAFIKAVRGEEA